MSLIGRLRRVGIVNELIIAHRISDVLAVGTIFVADEDYRVTKILYTPDVVGSNGSAVTCTVVKAAATATPVDSTTPMMTADAIDLKGTAHTVQNITLTTTKADLKLASGDKIGFDSDGTLTAVDGIIQVYLKRI